MKKLLAILLVSLLSFSLAACGGNTNPESTDPANPEVEDTANHEVEDTAPKSALDLLNTVWDSYKDEDKFSIAGGDFSEENMTPEAPGKFSLEDPAALETHQVFPASSIDKIDEAAAMRNMFNANTFTCGAYHVVDANEVANVATAIKDAVKANHWMCGFPEKVVIITVDDYVVALFGTEDLVNVFTANLTAIYTTAETVCDEPVM